MTPPERWLLAVALVLADLAAVFVPLAGLVAAYVVVARPSWFRQAVGTLYSGSPTGDG